MLFYIIWIVYHHSNEYLRPGIVHRLDKDTSGLLVVAKNDNAYRILIKAIKRTEV